VTERTACAVERARGNLAATPAVRQPYGRIGAFLITALLMFASFFTISSILASADLAPSEAWLLPLASGRSSCWRPRSLWAPGYLVIVKLIGLLIALLILPVLIMLNLLLYLVILPAAVQAIFG
jgi:hypothetical protein